MRFLIDVLAWLLAIIFPFLWMGMTFGWIILGLRLWEHGYAWAPLVSLLAIPWLFGPLAVDFALWRRRKRLGLSNEQALLQHFLTKH